MQVFYQHPHKSANMCMAIQCFDVPVSCFAEDGPGNSTMSSEPCPGLTAGTHACWVRMSRRNNLLFGGFCSP